MKNYDDVMRLKFLSDILDNDARIVYLTMRKCPRLGGLFSDFSDLSF